MRNKKNKKALVYNIILLLVAFASLTSGIIIINQKQGSLGEVEIGEKQTKIMDSYQEGEKIIYQIEKLGEYNFYKNVIELNKQAGWDKSDCDKYNGINMWTKKQEDDHHKVRKCFPIEYNGDDERKEDISNLKKEFSKTFNKRFNKFLEKEGFEVDNHEFDIKEINETDFSDNTKKKIKFNAKATNPITINIDTLVIQKKTVDEDKNKDIIHKRKFDYAWPVDDGELVSCYGYYGYAKSPNDGIKISVNTGSIVVAVEKGIVFDIGYFCYNDFECDSEHGNFIVIKHEEEDLYTAYTHLSEIGVTEGLPVNKGETIANSNKELGFYVYDNYNDVLKGRGKSPLCYLQEYGMKIKNDGCKSKYNSDTVSKSSYNLLKECENHGLIEIKNNYLEKKEKRENIYKIKPSFSVIVDYNLDDYRKAVNFSNYLLENCSYDNFVKVCIDIINKKEYEEKIKIGTCNEKIKKMSDNFYKERMVNFCYKSDKKFIFGEIPDIDFSLYVPDNAAPIEITDTELNYRKISNYNYIEITWTTLANKGIKDVKSYNIYRSNVPFTDVREAEIINVIRDSNENYYSDELVQPGFTYYYAVVAEDIFDNQLQELSRDAVKSIKIPITTT